MSPEIPRLPWNENIPPPNYTPPNRSPNKELRSTKEKKEILGSLLGNVDVLVDGVAKAGIFGLS
jgi:hypothetical protein